MPLNYKEWFLSEVEKAMRESGMTREKLMILKRRFKRERKPGEELRSIIYRYSKVYEMRGLRTANINKQLEKWRKVLPNLKGGIANKDMKIDTGTKRLIDGKFVIPFWERMGSNRIEATMGMIRILKENSPFKFKHEESELKERFIDKRLNIYKQTQDLFKKMAKQKDDFFIAPIQIGTIEKTLRRSCYYMHDNEYELGMFELFATIFQHPEAFINSINNIYCSGDIAYSSETRERVDIEPRVSISYERVKIDFLLNCFSSKDYISCFVD